MTSHSAGHRDPSRWSPFAGLALLPLAALLPGHAVAQSEVWRYEPVDSGALALSCTRDQQRACALAFCGADGRLGLGLTGWSPRGDREVREAFVAIDGAGRTGTLTRGETRLDGETLWQLDVDGTRVETQLERLRRGSQLRIEAGRSGEPFVFGLRGSSSAIGQLESRCARFAGGGSPLDDDGTITAEELIGGIAVGVIEDLLRQRLEENDPVEDRIQRRLDDERFAEAERGQDDRQFRDRFIEDDGFEGRRGRDWPEFDVNTDRAVSLVGSLGRSETTVVFPLRTRVGRLWVELREPGRVDVDRITAVYRGGNRRNLDLQAWRDSRVGRIRLPDGDLMRLEVRGNVDRGNDRVDILVTAAPPGITPARYDRPAQRGREWISLGDRSVGRGTDRDTIELGRNDGRFDAIGITVDGTPVAVDNILVDYSNGREERISVRDVVRDGERVVLELPTRRAQPVDKLVVTYAASRDGPRPTVRFWGRRLRE
ncbi:MAG: hypothetical protein AAF899_16340 [Pseudomonadota bacterium]